MDVQTTIEKIREEVYNLPLEEVFELYQKRDTFSMRTREERIRDNYIWLRYKENDPDGEYDMNDQILYPQHGWVSGEFKGCEFLKNLSDALNRIEGINASDGTMYKGGAIYNSKIIWWVTFDNIKSFNRFLWAGCFRYFPLTKNENWVLKADNDDPNYKENRIKMQLLYMDCKADRSKIEQDVNDMAYGVNNYADFLLHGDSDEENDNNDERLS